MVVHGAVEVLTVGHVPLLVIFGALHVEVTNPAQLPIEVSVLGHQGVVRHASSFDFIHLVGVCLSLGLQEDGLFLLEGLVEVLSVVGVVSLVEN